MAPGNLSDNVSSISDGVKEYINLRVDLVKLLVTEKIALVASLAAIAIMMFLLIMFLLLVLSMSFVYWFSISQMGPAWLGALLVAGFYLFFAGIVILFRNPIIVNPIIRKLTKLFMEDRDGNA